MLKKIMCRKCKSESTENFSIVTLGWLNIILHGISCLQEELNSSLKDRKVFCQMCQCHEAILSYEINNFIALDVEDSYRNDIIKNLKRSGDYSCVTSRSVRNHICEIPKSLKINNINYYLSGFISFTGSNEYGGIAHYYCFNYCGNDLVKNIQLGNPV